MYMEGGGGSQIVIRIGTFMETKYLLRFCHSRVQDFFKFILGGGGKKIKLMTRFSVT